MKQLWCLWTLLAALLLTACQPLIIDPRQVDAPEELYRDPNGRFTVPIPTNWQAASEEGYTQLHSPSGQIEIDILVLEGVALTDAAAQAWASVDPTFTLTPSVSEAPSRPGATRTLHHDYDAGAEQLVLAAAEAAGDLVYVTLIRGAMREVTERTAQINIILGGLTLTSAVAVDLRGVIPQPLTPALLDELRSYIEEVLVRFDVPGAAIAVVQNDEVIFREGFGVRERGKPQPMTPQTHLMIGSVTKTMTTLLMAQLVDDGIISWETPVQTILPHFAVADPRLSTELTMRHLVCACTGVPRRDLEFFFNANDMTAEKVIDSLRTFDFYTEFGETFQYSNQLVATGGWAAAAAASGAYDDLDNAYRQLIQERLFAPLGMEHTTFSTEEVLASDNYATPHRLSLIGERLPLPVTADQMLLGIAPAGAAWSTLDDMTRYLHTIMRQGVTPAGVQLVSAQNLQETWQPQVAVDATAHYGLGWFVDSYKQQPLLHHGGNTSGFTADLAFLPESDLGLVILTNGRLANAFTHAVRFRLFELAFAQPQEYEATAAFTHVQMRELALAPVAAAVPVDPALVTPYLGRYTNAALGEVSLTLEDATLILDSGELTMAVLAHIDAAGRPIDYVINSYIGPVLGVGVQLVNDAAGNPELILTKGVDEYRFVRLP